MFSKTIALAAVLATVGVNAIPHVGHNHQHLHRRHHGLQHAARDTTLEARDDTYTLHVHNQCSDTKYFGLFEITSDFQMNSKCEPTEITSGGDAKISANYKDIGLRLSATADQGAAAQWAPQSLAEFGYSGWSGVEGIAYDVSMMTGCDKKIGVKIEPLDNGNGSGECDVKVCTEQNGFPLSQCWTNPDQTSDGSPADTVCYKGKTDFKVTFCPSDA
ncbi:hypothetical protein D0869_14890 [Hortaea werneckii]|uniref:Uncharacterized protein n=3 Tax=Hortaea werneckii TaxID=91943 RepID=A0A3M6W1U9_HORWE|nr:hypothetical protein KC354_g7465 [Hortaea werneckii]RMX72170.1 hypothetical protein D0869_14890 [Hortaea werneckii]